MRLSAVFPAVPLCIGQGDLVAVPLPHNDPGRKAAPKDLGRPNPPRIWFLTVVAGWELGSSGQPVTLACSVTFVLGLEFPEGWP